MKKILKSYLKRLTNISGGNRTLLLLRLTSDQYIDIHDLDFVNNEPSFSIISDLIAGKNEISLGSQVDPRDGGGNEISKRLKKLQRIEKFIYEERGSRDLYVGWPMIRGKFMDGSLTRCPLMFFPVELQMVDNEWRLCLRKEVNVTLNKTFLLAYSYFNEVQIDDELVERVFDDFDTDSRVFRTALYKLFKESPVEINFNQDNFMDKLQSFQDFKKDEFDKQFDRGEMKLYPEAVLGIFPQAGSHLVPDYIDLIENPRFNDLEEFFAARTVPDDREGLNLRYTDFSYLQKVKEELTFTPFKMDAFQENALKAVKRGNSVVVQGPPGTGKSQLICNLISDFIARGRKVLLVSQKRAALDVVFERMNGKGLGNFIGLVHDIKNDRKEIYEKIARQIESLNEYQTRNNSLDSIQLERGFNHTSRRIDQITEGFEEFKYALYDDEECGMSVKELYLTSDLDAPSVELKQEYRDFRMDRIDKFARDLRAYTNYAIQFNKEDHPWYHRKSFLNYGVSELKRIREVLEEIPKFQESIAKRTSDIVSDQIPIEECEQYLEREEEFEELLALVGNKKVFEYFREISRFTDSDTDPLWLANAERVVMECYKGEGIELSLRSDQLGKFQEVLERRMRAKRSIYRWMKWRMFSQDKYIIKRVLVANELPLTRKSLRQLVKKIDNRLNLEHNLTKLRSYEWLSDYPDSYEKVKLQNWFDAHKQALKAKLIFNSMRNLKEYITPASMSKEEFTNAVQTLLEIFREIPQKKEEWKIYLSTNQISNVLNDVLKIDNLSKSLNRDFDSLCEFDKLRDEFSSVEMEVIERLFENAAEVTEEAIAQLFQNSLRIAWIEHIEAKYPVLRTVSSQKFRREEQELQASVKEKLKLSNDILLMKAREKTYQDIEYNRLNNRVTYRDLHHQVTKKKRIWPLRKMINNFYDELFSLIPCWMASPESVSALFPMEEIFDLVLFDEASQTFVEKGIPAMYRGKQIMVAGDNKQLRPNDLYKVRWEDDETEDPALEVDSLLELVEKHLMNIQLQGHYRSKSLDLIDFSNKHFYDGKLTLLPDFEVVKKNEPAIHYIKVDGIWENNTNEVEARKVAELIFELLVNSPEKEIGVVTFNARQQMLVLDVLESESMAKNQPLPDNLFVKNIENVQGDERDIIIFSTAYGPDKNGKMIMQFGSLNLAGGENRLNVAITRARESIFIVSSIHPQQLKVSESLNEGPKLLRKYLEYSLDVSKGNFVPEIPDTNGYSVEWYLKNLLKSWISENVKDFEVKQDLPFADLTVKKAQDYVGLLLTDDDLYHNSVSMKEVHVYKPFTLSGKQWNFKGVFSREYWQDKDSVKESIVRFMNQKSIT